MAKYRRITRLGGGGFGEVWHCTRGDSGKDVAMKVLKDPENDDALKRFAREVRILASLEHPNIVRVLDRHMGDQPYFTMPLYRHSLEGIMEDVAGELDRIVSIFTRVLDAVVYAHEQHVIHRDLKPGNVLLNSDSDVVVSDFGLGRRFDAVTTRQTHTGDFLGSPDYMAPEQIRNAANADERADVYSLGKILYEMFTGDGPGGILEIDRVPARFRPIITRCVRNNADERYDSVDDVRTAWRLATDPDSVLRQRGNIPSILEHVEEGLTTAQARELAQSLADIDDADLIHEVFMELDDDALQLMWEHSPQPMDHVVKSFAALVGSGGWGFDYTDRLGNKLRDLNAIVDDYELRARVIVATAELGERHNRFHVLGLFGRMMRGIDDPVLADLVREKLEALPNHRLNGLRGYVEVNAIPAELRDLFAD